jgi:hypothetical protein
LQGMRRERADHEELVFMRLLRAAVVRVDQALRHSCPWPD